MKLNLTFLRNLLLTVLAIFAPAKQAIFTALALCIIDLITGVLAAKKQSIPITSHGLKRSVIKLTLYLTAILLSFLTQQYLMGPFVPVMTFVTSMIGITELTSVLENLNIIAGGSLLSAIIQNLQKKTSANGDE